MPVFCGWHHQHGRCRRPLASWAAARPVNSLTLAQRLAVQGQPPSFDELARASAEPGRRGRGLLVRAGMVAMKKSRQALKLGEQAYPAA